jgi:acetoacetyl-CoA synthetase
MKNEKPLWIPSEEKIQSSELKAFMHQCARSQDTYDEFRRWTVDCAEEFWSQLWDFCDIVGDKGDIVIQNPDQMTGGQFFPKGHVNYAENMLRKRDDDIAMIFRNEKGVERTLTFNDFYNQVSLWAQALKAMGLKKGDRVAACMPNCPETIIACVATTSIGAIWSSASPDFGAQGLIDRFAQIEPKILIAVDGYFYTGKSIDCLEKIGDVQNAIPDLVQTIIVPFVNEAPEVDGLQEVVLMTDILSRYSPQEIDFEKVSFNHPLFIMFSSGTTGVPKCIVHGHGGTLLQHLKEHKLQCDIKAGDRLFYFTTCGWMMWNWLITGLANGSTLLLYDGNPFYPNRHVLWDFTSDHGAALFGTAAKYIDAMRNAKMSPKDTHDLSALKLMTSTGSPLVHESFEYVYDSIKKDVHLASISGGTDIVSCFMIGNPISPVWRGELQGAGLGLAIDVFDDEGNSCEIGKSGELVCTRPFPCMPVGFWNDTDGKKFKKAYFESFDNVWAHGDWVEKTPHGGFIIHGRSDATLNPGGVRIGTAEIYRQVEKISAVKESIAVGQDWNGDVRVILFVTLNDDTILDDDLKSEIKHAIRTGASPRHVPSHIIQVNDIPRTKSGKITELAVKHVIHGREVKNKEALANPEALELYKDIDIMST